MLQKGAVLGGLFALLLCSSSNTNASGVWTEIPARDNRGTVLIRTSWPGGQGTGTGFVLTPQGHILTVAHQFPKEHFAEQVYEGETEALPEASQNRQSVHLKVVHLDREKDVAVLSPSAKVTFTPVPINWSWVPRENEEVYFRGFPEGGRLTAAWGRVARSGAAVDVPTDALLSKGHSGSPVYNGAGEVVCMARGGHPVAEVKNATVMGKGFCSALSLVRDSVGTGIVGLTKATGAPSSTKAMGPTRVSYAIDETKETPFKGPQDLTKPASTKRYENYRFQALPGYRIVGHEFADLSSTKVSNLEFKTAADGSSIQVVFDLTSGPGWDRWRGWLKGNLTTTQVPKY